MQITNTALLKRTSYVLELVSHWVWPVAGNRLKRLNHTYSTFNLQVMANWLEKPVTIWLSAILKKYPTDKHMDLL